MTVLSVPSYGGLFFELESMGVFQFLFCLPLFEYLSSLIQSIFLVSSMVSECSDKEAEDRWYLTEWFGIEQAGIIFLNYFVGSGPQIQPPALVGKSTRLLILWKNISRRLCLFSSIVFSLRSLSICCS